MNTPSAFQAAHPLSPKKFAKKFIGRAFANIFWAILIAVVYFGVASISSDPETVLWPTVGAFVIAYAALCILQAWYIKVYIRTYYYDCGEQFITIKKGVFAPAEIHVQYQKIQDVYVDQDILDRVMGLYDVHIASATMASSIEAHIDGVSRETAERIKELLLAKIGGGSVSGGTSMPASAVATAKVQFTSDKKISRDTYPINSRWNTRVVVGALFTSLLYALIFAGRFTADDSFSGFGTGFVVIFAICFVCSVVYQFIWKSNYYFECTPEFILLRTGVFNRQENHMPYKSIQNVSMNQSFIEKLFGLATVKIENAATSYGGRNNQKNNGSISIVGQTPAKAQEITEILNQTLASTNTATSPMGV